MVGRGYCLEDSCATIWVKKPKKIKTKEISYTFEEIINPDYDARPFWGLTTIEASGWDLESDWNGIYPYPDQGDNSMIARNVRNLNYARENNIEGNQMPTFNRYLNVAEGSYRGTIPVGSRDIPKSYAVEGKGFHRVIDTEQGGYSTVWEGEVDWIFLSDYQEPSTDPRITGTVRYDVNILPKGGDRIETVIEGRLHTFREIRDGQPYTRYYRPIIEQVVGQLNTSKLTLYDVDGIPGNTQVIERYYPPTFLEVREKEEIETTEYLAVEIEKRPWFDRLEVVHFAYNFTNIGIVETSRNVLKPFAEIEPHCLNVYVTNNTPSLIPSFVLSEGYIEPMFPWETELKQHICNEDGSNNLPQYIVVCGCKAECPPGTCEIDCGDHFCCYDNEGIAIAIIPKQGGVS